MSVFGGIEDKRREHTAEDLVGRERRPWLHGSPSQIKTFLLCPSKWYAEKIYGLSSPSSPAQELGVELHNQAEHYLITGRAPGGETAISKKAGPILAAGLHRLPVPPVPEILVETFFALEDPELGGILIVGKVDLTEPEARRVTDHKSTSNFRYMRSAEELSGDPQAVTYVTVIAPLFNGRDTLTGDVYLTPARDGRPSESYPVRALDFDGLVELGFRHVYYRTRDAPASRESEVRLTPATLRANYLSNVRAPMQRMKALVDAELSLVDVPHKLTGCAAFGGCHLKTVCAGLGRRTMGAASGFFAAATDAPPRENGSTMGLLDAMKKNKAGQAAPPPVSDPFAAAITASAPPPAAPEAETVVVKKPSSFDWSDEAPAVNPPDGVPHGVDYVDPIAEAAKEAKAAAEKAKAEKKALADVERAKKDPIVPFDFDFVEAGFRGERLRGIKKAPFCVLFAELRAELESRGTSLPDRDDKARFGHIFTAPTPGLSVFARTALRDASAEAISLLLNPPTQAELDLAPQSPTEPEEEAKEPAPEETPERVLSVKPSLTEEAPSPEKPASEPVEEVLVPTTTTEAPEEPAAPSRALRTLFVDCSPRRVPVVYFSDLVAPYATAAAEEIGAVHYRVAEYSRGTDNVVARIASALNRGELELPANLVVETSLPLGKHCLAELLPRFDLVVERMGW